MNVLLHVCCGPCTAGTVPFLVDENIHPVLYWYNPNIHPFREYEARLSSLRDFSKNNALPLIIDGAYSLRDFLKATSDGVSGRCSVCYSMRLTAAAAHAASQGFDAFTTTLLVSPVQNRDAIIDAGQRASEKHGVPFLERDFRSGYQRGADLARRGGLYMQKYCGCIFSEEERYASRAARLPSGFISNYPSGLHK